VGCAARSATAVVFSSPVASLSSSLIGFTEHANAQRLDEFAYLGAPLVVNRTDADLALYRFRGAPRAEAIGRMPIVGALEQGVHADWVRKSVAQELESPQLSLSLDVGRELLIEATQSALSSRVDALTKLVAEEKRLDQANAFRLAITIIRGSAIGKWEHPNLSASLLRYAREMGERLHGQISFANIPPESIAELYERFAVDDAARRRGGVVYTPAWLARYVVSRLPPDAFRQGTAIDPTCGSGTFLVCYLERLVELLAQKGERASPKRLKDAIVGYDLDTVAIEAARLALDLLGKALGVNSPEWRLKVTDTTTAPVHGDWLVGNLPFGYRTHAGRADVSSVILQNVLESAPDLLGLSIILPDSLTYTKTAAQARSLLRNKIRLQEVTRLPESAFLHSAVQTLVVTGRRGESSRELLVREVEAADLSKFRVGTYVSRTYVSQLPTSAADPWRFSPLGNVFARADRSTSRRLKDVAQIHVGLQIYGHEDKALSRRANATRPLLHDPNLFAKWSSRLVAKLPNVSGEPTAVRRRGPWDLFPSPKVIVRSTTYIASTERLAAIPDGYGLWFTDKFTGIWPTDEEIGIRALSAYLQTDFARAWFAVNNPSRKLRIATLGSLPIPDLPPQWWSRAEQIAKPDRVVWPPSSKDRFALLQPDEQDAEWVWLNAAVNTILGLDATASAMLSTWLSEEGPRGETELSSL
jgi:hypothetical protein